ncbi:F-box domain containing protein, partial [Tanacetum coccineum]
MEEKGNRFFLPMEGVGAGRRLALEDGGGVGRRPDVGGAGVSRREGVGLHIRLYTVFIPRVFWQHNILNRLTRWILTRVPPKAVGRFKSVCKTWYALLSGNDFVRAHCSRLAIPSNQKVLVIEQQTCSIHPINFETHDYEPGTSITIPFDHRSYDSLFNCVSILSHLNGLLCVCNNFTSELFLWNPVTTAFKRLPPPYSNEFYTNILDAVGLYTDTHDDFKVLYIRRRDATLAVNVYSRIDESWRNIPLTLPSEYLTTRFYWSSGTLCGGALYFTVMDVAVGGSHFMISFDVNSEQFCMISLPPIPNDGLSHISLVNAQDELVMFAATGYREMKIDMWILQEGTWYRIHSFPLISQELWCSITHYVTNGNKWFVMAQFQKIFEIDTGRMWAEIRLSSLSINEAENEVVEFGDDDDAHDERRFTLVGKVYTHRIINFQKLKRILMAAWRPRRSVSIQELEGGLFLAIFDHLVDMRRVLDDGPWSVERDLVMLKPLDDEEQPSNVDLSKIPFWIRLLNLPFSRRTEKYVRNIAERLGSVVEVDTRRLKEGIMNRKNEKVTIGLCYERLPNFCYWCGHLGHTQKECLDKPAEVDGRTFENWPFQESLRAPPLREGSTRLEQAQTIGDDGPNACLKDNRTLYMELNETEEHEETEKHDETVTQILKTMEDSVTKAKDSLTRNSWRRHERVSSRSDPPSVAYCSTEKQGNKREWIEVGGSEHMEVDGEKRPKNDDWSGPSLDCSSSSRISEDFNFLVVNPVRRAGGLMFMWKKNLNVKVMNYSKNHVDFCVVEDSGTEWRGSGIYGWPKNQHKYRTWILLRSLKIISTLPWVCFGDFNEVLYAFEKVGMRGCNMRELNAFETSCHYCNLYDLGFKGCSMTWSNGRRG